MPLVKLTLQEAMKKAFVAGETAMEVEAKKNIRSAKPNKTSAKDIKEAGGVTTAVATTGTIGVHAGTGTGAVT